MMLVAFATWMISLAIEDVSIVDYIWSMLSLAAAHLCLSQGIENSISLVLLLWSPSGLCDDFFLMIRGRNKPEDRRYQVIRKRNSPILACKASTDFYIGLVAWVLSTIFVVLFDSAAADGAAQPWTVWHGIGVAVAVWLIYQTIADNQLHAFNQQVVPSGKTLSTGLWRYSRHSYFGEFSIWWGWFIYAIPTASLWILVAPVNDLPPA